ncbi:MAG TPA: hemerythrin domain-containing protein [Gaiellaceae bacterium]|nr:hemerythrin domain-containing protein [Gaiellaceae bacterium]
MKRHPGLVPFSHDHHHGLVQARRLRRAADGDAEGLPAAGAAFLDFFVRETAAHFRDEEELLFPLLAAVSDPPPPELTEALAQHARIRALVERLRREVRKGAVEAATVRELGELLDAHISLEERELFGLLEDAVADEELRAIDLPPRRLMPEGDGPVVRLAAGEGPGPVWGTASEDLNATLLAWPPGGGTPEHVNVERDILFVVLAGSGTLELDGEPHALAQAHAAVVPKGRRFRIEAGPSGLRYLSVHLRRPYLQVAHA